MRHAHHDISDRDGREGGTLLLVGADRPRRSFLADNLSADGYEVLDAGACAAARRLLERTQVDLVIIDRDLPDASGLEFLRALRGADRRLAGDAGDALLVVIREGGSPFDRIRCFEQGADDWLGHEELFYPELRARIGALLRRRRRQHGLTRLRVGALEIDALARQAWVDGRPVTLAAKEFSLLLALAREPGRVFKRAELMASVWGWSDGGSTAQRTRTLDSHASRLRRKLRAHGGDAYVVNVWGVGYRLVELACDQRHGRRLAA